MPFVSASEWSPGGATSTWLAARRFERAARPFGGDGYRSALGAPSIDEHVRRRAFGRRTNMTVSMNWRATSGGGLARRIALSLAIVGAAGLCSCVTTPPDR